MECKRETSIENAKRINTMKKEEKGREMKFMAQFCTQNNSFVILILTTILLGGKNKGHYLPLDSFEPF